MQRFTHGVLLACALTGVITAPQVVQIHEAVAGSLGQECRTGEFVSFDCSTASTKAEKAICRSKMASAADCLLSYVYSDASDIAKSQGIYENLQRDQSAWIASRNTECGSNELCLANSISRRALSLIQKYDLGTYGILLRKGAYSTADFATVSERDEQSSGPVEPASQTKYP